MATLLGGPVSSHVGEFVEILQKEGFPCRVIRGQLTTVDELFVVIRHPNDGSPMDTHWDPIRRGTNLTIAIDNIQRLESLACTEEEWLKPFQNTCQDCAEELPAGWKYCSTCAHCH